MSECIALDDTDGSDQGNFSSGASEIFTGSSDTNQENSEGSDDVDPDSLSLSSGEYVQSSEPESESIVSDADLDEPVESDEYGDMLMDHSDENEATGKLVTGCPAKDGTT